MPFAVPLPRLVVASLAAAGENSEQIAERPEVEIEIALLEPEVLRELVHALFELHERLAETLDLLVVEVPRLHAAKRLTFHELPEQLDQSEHELREPALEALLVALLARAAAPVVGERPGGRERRRGDAADARLRRRPRVREKRWRCPSGGCWRKATTPGQN